MPHLVENDKFMVIQFKTETFQLLQKKIRCYADQQLKNRQSSIVTTAMTMNRFHQQQYLFLNDLFNATAMIMLNATMQAQVTQLGKLCTVKQRVSSDCIYRDLPHFLIKSAQSCRMYPLCICPSPVSSDNLIAKQVNYTYLQ